MSRKIVRIDEEKCVGCGLCASACHEGAIGVIDGKARLVTDECCDGLGHCLPACPSGAISLVPRETSGQPHSYKTRLSQWPVQIKLVPQIAPSFKDADLLIAADCTAYIYSNFHDEYVKGRTTLIGCPKLDACDYSEKLTAILKLNDVKSVTVTRMEVPCCGGIESVVWAALQKCGRQIPHQVVTISIDGEKL